MNISAALDQALTELKARIALMLFIQEYKLVKFSEKNKCPFCGRSIEFYGEFFDFGGTKVCDTCHETLHYIVITMLNDDVIRDNEVLISLKHFL